MHEIRTHASWNSPELTLARLCQCTNVLHFDLGRLGWSEGKNIRIDYRFGPGDPALLEPYAAELVGLAPDAILAISAAAALAAPHNLRVITGP